jgi:hypothetical protein
MESVTVPTLINGKRSLVRGFLATIARLMIVLPLLMLTLPTLSHGQAISSNGGAIQGTITDASGAILPNATVVITSPDTNQTRTVTTDSAGFYSVGPLNPGDYTVTVTVQGFKALSVKTVVKTGTVTAGSFRMTVGSTDTTVEVNAGALQVNTDQVGVSDTVTREQIEALPINGRNFLDTQGLQPGVILQSGLTFDPTKAGYSAISLDGVAGRTTRILLDGQDITDETVGTTIMNIPTGAIDESQINRSTQDVSGEVTSTGQVLASTRSGTNSLHGQVFYEFQDYRAGFAATTGGYNAPFQRNQFGGEVGGPIIKDKLFFFADVERVQQVAKASATTSPTFAGVKAKFPTVPEPFRDTFSIGRLDYNAPHGYHLFFRAAYDDNSSFSNYSDLYSLYDSRNNVPAFVGGADFITGKFTHSIRGGYEKFHNLLGDGTAGVTSIYNPTSLIGVPVTLLDPQDNFYAGPNYLAPQGTYQSDKQIRYDGTWTHGAHSIKFGGSFNRILGGGFATFYGPSLYTTFGAAQAFAGGSGQQGCGGVVGAAACTGDPINGYSAEYYILGNGNGLFTEKPGFGLTGGGTFDRRASFYGADSWKINSYLTAVAGLRWSVDTDRANQDLPTPLCSSVDPSLQFSGCTGNTPLFNQFQPGLGVKTKQPYANFGPQVGFVFSPGSHKLSIRGGAGIFYESDIFNNTSNARSAVVNANGNFFNYTGLCGPEGTTLVLPNGTKITSYKGVQIATICGESIAQAAPQISALKAQFQAASNTGGPNPGYIGTGGGLQSFGIYGGPYQTPYSIQFNGGVQEEIRKGTLIAVDYAHSGTRKIPQLVDVNHVGAARTLNVALAQSAIAATLQYCNAPSINAAVAPNGCAPSATVQDPNPPAPYSASIIDFASNGLDSGVQYDGGYPNSFYGQAQVAAFPGINPNVGKGLFVIPGGRAQYDALQVVFKQQGIHPAPGIESSNMQISYNLSRVVNAVDPSSTDTAGAADEFFNSYVWDNDHPNGYMGRSNLDHTNELSFGGDILLKIGLQAGVVGHFFSASPTALTLDNSSGAPGEIFRTDVTGDGTTGDLLPGTKPGQYMHEIKGAGLNKVIGAYNAQYAGKVTPAGQALISAGLMTQAQLVALNGVQQQIATAPTVPLPNSAQRDLDLNFTYPIKLTKLREGLSLVPGIAIYNVFNMSNFGSLTGLLANTDDAGGSVGSVNNYINGPNNNAVEDGVREQRGSGTFDSFAPRTTEFNLKLNF